jgi:hypothetical protein
VFACLYLLKTIPDIKVVFFSREENGCKGSRGIDKEFFVDCRYLIQLDRKNKGDFIQTYYGNKTISHDFSSEIGLIKKEYGYKNCTGTVTDVMKLWDSNVGISCINLSCGYYKAHTNYEYISVEALENSIKFTEAIIHKMKPKRYPHLPPPPTVVSQTPSTFVYLQCFKCKEWKKDFLLYKRWNKETKKMERFCWACKDRKGSHYKPSELNTPNRKRNPNSAKAAITDNLKAGDNEIVLFACFECGKTTSELQQGQSLKYADNGHLYCTTCKSVFFSTNNKPLKCEVCNTVIPKDHYHTIVEGVLVCGECAADLRDVLGRTSTVYADDCFVCNKVIPKGHKIIERFGVRVCEECACPSDIVIEDNKE